MVGLPQVISGGVGAKLINMWSLGYKLAYVCVDVYLCVCEWACLVWSRKYYFYIGVIHFGKLSISYFSISKSRKFVLVSSDNSHGVLSSRHASKDKVNYRIIVSPRHGIHRTNRMSKINHFLTSNLGLQISWFTRIY